jgi:hypothetical protein
VVGRIRWTLLDFWAIEAVGTGTQVWQPTFPPLHANITLYPSNVSIPSTAATFSTRAAVLVAILAATTRTRSPLCPDCPAAVDGAQMLASSSASDLELSAQLRCAFFIAWLVNAAIVAIDHPATATSGTTAQPKCRAASSHGSRALGIPSGISIVAGVGADSVPF